MFQPLRFRSPPPSLSLSSVSVFSLRNPTQPDRRIWESICFLIAVNERAIRSDNTSEETPERTVLKGGDCLLPLRACLQPRCDDIASLLPPSVTHRHRRRLRTRVSFVCGPGIIAVFTCWTEKLAHSRLFTPAERRQTSPAAVLSV